ncbi:hypothetical protein VF13_42915 [Nostoc linckia z16]|nr:hypothetical protein VF13_42915 [Nostoc linckia z16]
MKNLAIAAMLAVSLGAAAQVNKNVTRETTTTTVTVNNGSETKQLVKNETTSAQQNIALKDAESKKLNKDIQPTPVQVTKTTTVSGDGITPQIGQATYYRMNGRNYMFVTDNSGYKISTPDDLGYGTLRKTSNNSYIYRTKNGTSVGYFNADGDFVVESYNDNTDGVTVETYTRIKQ